MMALPLHSQSPSPAPSRAFHVYGQTLSSTPGYLTVLESGVLTNSTHTSLNLDGLVFSNLDSVTHTVTLVDCQSTPATMVFAVPASPMIWTISLPDVRMVGCAKFSVDSGGTAATVWAWATGTR
jgi:hypothetical protein